MPTSTLKPGQRREWITDYFPLGGSPKTIREQAAPLPAAPAAQNPPATPAAPKPSAPVDPRETIFDSYTDKMVELLDDENAAPQATADEIAKWLKRRARALAEYDAAMGSESVASKPAKKMPRRLRKTPPTELPPLSSTGPENEDDDSGLEHFLGSLRGLTAHATSSISEGLRRVREGEEYLAETSYGDAPRTAEEFHAGLRIIRE